MFENLLNIVRRSMLCLTYVKFYIHSKKTTPIKRQYRGTNLLQTAITFTCGNNISGSLSPLRTCVVYLPPPPTLGKQSRYGKFMSCGRHSNSVTFPTYDEYMSSSRSSWESLSHISSLHSSHHHFQMTFPTLFIYIADEQRRTFPSIFKRRSIIHVRHHRLRVRRKKKKNQPSSFFQPITHTRTHTYTHLATRLNRSLLFFISVVNQKYNVQVHDEYVMSGNTAVLKCQVSVSTTSHMPRGALIWPPQCLWVWVVRMRIWLLLGNRTANQ